jgi:hypothetical protein
MSSWHPSTPPSESSPSSRVMVVQALPTTSYSSVPVEEIACPTTVDESHRHVPQTFSFPPTCVSGLFESDPRIFGFVADATPTGFWGGISSQKPWIPTPPVQVSQITASPPIQSDSDRSALPAGTRGNGLLPCSGIPEALSVVPNISEGITGPGFTMTCPVPHCYFQCQTTVDMWKHLTWTHVRPNSTESGIESIVERVVLGGSL